VTQIMYPYILLSVYWVNFRFDEINDRKTGHKLVKNPSTMDTVLFHVYYIH